jgi:hypothetical protein
MPANGSHSSRAANPSKRTPAIASAPSPLLDAKAAGTLLGVPATWMLAEARADRVPYVRLGRYVRFDADELDAWWRTRARGPWRRRSGAEPVAQGRNTA